MTTAHVFPGQGSQRPGMGRAFYDAWPETRERFDALDDELDRNLAALCFEGTDDDLRRTENTQPAVFAAGLATHAGVAARAGDPDYVAGHSLGHVTALAATGGLDPVAGIDLVRERGRLMADAARERGPGTMVAVLLADPDLVAAACAAHDGASVAGFNAPRQTVISGTEVAVARVREAIDAEARARFVDLDVGAAFHSPVMEPAAEPFREVVERTPLDAADVPVASDVSSEFYTEPAVARRDLAKQVTAPVDWVGAVEALADRGVDRYVEFPPAGTLAELVGKIDPGAETVTLAAPGEVESL